jgi:hypothetical protein
MRARGLRGGEAVQQARLSRGVCVCLYARVDVSASKYQSKFPPGVSHRT